MYVKGGILKLESTQPHIKTTKLFLFMLLVGLLTAIGGEIKIIPFEEGPFRFGLGSIIFFFALLIRPLPIVSTGLLTALIVIFGRSLLDIFIYGQSFLTHIQSHICQSFQKPLRPLCFILRY